MNPPDVCPAPRLPLPTQHRLHHRLTKLWSTAFPIRSYPIHSSQLTTPTQRNVQPQTGTPLSSHYCCNGMCTPPRSTTPVVTHIHCLLADATCNCNKVISTFYHCTTSHRCPAMMCTEAQDLYNTISLNIYLPIGSTQSMTK